MRNLVFGIQKLLTGGFLVDYSNYKYVLFPAIGIFLTVIFVKYILRKPVRDGIPNVLYAISKKHGILDAHNTFSSIITASLTVGFGGSVGLEGPTVVTGSAWGSNIGKLLGLNQKQIIAIIGFSSAVAGPSGSYTRSDPMAGAMSRRPISPGKTQREPLMSPP